MMLVHHLTYTSAGMDLFSTIVHIDLEEEDVHNVTVMNLHDTSFSISDFNARIIKLCIYIGVKREIR